MSDTDYLKETVGEALALGCAATLTAAPADPVEYLAFWLKKYVENQRTMSQLEDAKKARERAVADERADQILRWKESEIQMGEREAALRRLLNYNGEDAWVLWQMAMNTIVQFTSASAAYVANVSHPEEPEPAVPEEEPAEGGPTEEQDYAPFIEPEPAPAPEAPAEGDAAHEEGDGSAAEGGEAPPPENPEGGEAAAPGKVFDYSQKYLEFVVHNLGRELPEGSKVLRRPAPPPEGEEPPNPPPAAPLLFNILDQNLKSLYFPDVLLAPNFPFPGGFPRPGAFEAQAVLTNDKEIKAVVCADTLVPAGSGLALSESDRAFITRVADALEAHLTAAQDRFAETQAENLAALKDRRRKLQASLEEALTPPTAPADEEATAEGVETAEAAAAAPTDGGEEPAEGEEASAAEEEIPPEVPPEEAAPEGEAAAAEGEDGEAREPPPRDPAKELEAAEKRADRAAKVLARAVWEAKQAAKAATSAEAESAKQDKLLEVIRSFLLQVEVDAKADFGAYITSPPVTFRLLRAAMILLRPAESATVNWTTVRALAVGGPMLQEVRDFSTAAFLQVPEADRKRLRLLVRGLNTPDSVAAMDKECPRSSYGFFLHRFLGQLRTAALALGALRAAQGAKEKADKKAEDAQKAVDELAVQVELLKNEVTAAEEEKARLAAEAAAAAPAEGEAAAPAEGEGEAPAEDEE